MSAIPSAAVKAIKQRDGDLCLRCGLHEATDTHHRMRRRDGQHAVSNLVRLCRHCHGWVHANVKAAKAEGWIIPALRKPALDPQQVPVRTRFGWLLLHDKTTGQVAARIPDSVAIARLVRMDMREAA